MTGAEIVIAKGIIDAVLPPLVDGIIWVATHVHHESAALAMRRLDVAGEDSDWLGSNLVERVECDTKKKGWKRRFNKGTTTRAGSPNLLQGWLSEMMPDDQVLLIELEPVGAED
jgi:hypothetical protein